MRWSALPLAVSLILAALTTSLAKEAAEETAARPPARLNPLWDLDLESLEATRTLPLFTPSRKAPVVPRRKTVEVAVTPPPAPPTPSSPPPLRLMGVIMTGSTDIALLRNRETSEVIRLSSGEDYDGWSIEFMDSRSVEFRNGDQVETLTMFDQFDAVSDAGGLPPDVTGAVPGMPPGDDQLLFDYDAQLEEEFSSPEDLGFEQ